MAKMGALKRLIVLSMMKGGKKRWRSLTIIKQRMMGHGYLT